MKLRSNMIARTPVGQHLDDEKTEKGRYIELKGRFSALAIAIQVEKTYLDWEDVILMSIRQKTPGTGNEKVRRSHDKVEL